MNTMLQVSMTRVEWWRAIQCLRACRAEVEQRMMQLEEAQKVFGDGRHNEAILACANDIAIVSGASAKIWIILNQNAG